uniref:Uncharacterized protein n=1 Tax=Vitis vinifera TaxID=29760 RepID=A5C772_VITVI|nr:hypothetical protein VITISV_036137 [Vitis vinifera]
MDVELEHRSSYEKIKGKETVVAMFDYVLPKAMFGYGKFDGKWEGKKIEKKSRSKEKDCYTVTLIKSLIHSMSTQDLSEQQNGSERDIEEEETLLLDLNYPPPSDNVALESTFTSSSPLELYAKDQRWSNPQATNNVDASDDDVVILSSPRSFLEARKNSRRNAEVIMVNDNDIEMPGHIGIVFDDIEMQGHQDAVLINFGI